MSHHKLSLLLEAHGISGQIRGWIDAWLTDRQQRVVLNGQASGWLPVTSGVPQGSVLGPTLFVIFINTLDIYLKDLPALISKFADDSKVGMCVNNESDALVLQDVINTLCDWSNDLSMQFNADKCKVMHIGKKNLKHSYTMNGFAPGGTVLQPTEEEKDVGVRISNTLKSSAQCQAAAKKANQLVGQMARAFTYRDKFNWIRLYKVYVRPHLEYCVQVWSPWNQKDIDLLEDVQRRVVRMTSGLSSGTYMERLAELDLTTLEERRQRGDMIQTWKILHGHDDVKEETWFTRKNRVSTVNTRLNSSPFNLELKRAKSELRNNSFSIRVVNSWNSLPDLVKGSTTLNSFKNSYDRYVSSNMDTQSR